MNKPKNNADVTALFEQATRERSIFIPPAPVSVGPFAIPVAKDNTDVQEKFRKEFEDRYGKRPNPRS